MAINLTNPNLQKENQSNVVTAQAATTEITSIEPVQQYDIVADKEQLVQNMDMQKIDKLTSQIDVSDMSTIVSFGAEAAEEISKASDAVLNNMNMAQINETSEILTVLAKIMDKIDVKEIKENPGLVEKLFHKAENQIQKIVDKYKGVGAEIDKVYVELRKHQDEIKTSNQKLSQMFDANVNFYHELENYIYAGEQGCKEIQAAIEETQNEMQTTGNQELQFQLTSYQQALSLLEQRVQDLRTAEIVAMESIPMLKTMEFSNYNLYRKMETSIIISLPVFKQALAQALLLKRQKIQAQAVSALDERTNELLMKNAQNTMKIATETARMASGSSIKAETLESAWTTIKNGIAEIQQIEGDARKKREEDKVRLQNIKNDFNKNYHMPDKK